MSVSGGQNSAQNWSERQYSLALLLCRTQAPVQGDGGAPDAPSFGSPRPWAPSPAPQEVTGAALDSRGRNSEVVLPQTAWWAVMTATELKGKDLRGSP